MGDVKVVYEGIARRDDITIRASVAPRMTFVGALLVGLGALASAVTNRRLVGILFLIGGVLAFLGALGGVGYAAANIYIGSAPLFTHGTLWGLVPLLVSIEGIVAGVLRLFSLAGLEDTRTVRAFTVLGNVWPVLESWAQEAGYRLRESGPSRRSYQKGWGVLVAPRMIEVTQAGAEVRLGAWVDATSLLRFFALFQVPAETRIESGGWFFGIPRRFARNEVSQLLERLGQPKIS